MAIVPGIPGFDFKLPHSSYESFGTVQHILVDGKAVEGKLIFGVAILVDNLHLFNNCGLSAFARTYLQPSAMLSSRQEGPMRT